MKMTLIITCNCVQSKNVMLLFIFYLVAETNFQNILLFYACGIYE